MPARNVLSRFLASPDRVAQTLDWRKGSGSARILSLSIRRDAIDLAVACHPENERESRPQSLPSIPLSTQVINNRKVIAGNVTDELVTILDDWNVCGLVVSWPVQKEGWCGAPCGRVLHTLDHLINTPGVVKNRQICLWDEEHRDYFAEDKWGRASIYSVICTESVHLASKEQYQEPSTLAADVWNDFCRSHWPQLYLSSTTIANPEETNKPLVARPVKQQLVKEQSLAA